MPHFPPRRNLFALVTLLACLEMPCAAQSSLVLPSPPTAANLRGLLPFPEVTLGPATTALAMGLDYTLDSGYSIFRNGDDGLAKILAVRRQMTGGVADAARCRVLGRLYRRAGLPAKSKAAFGQSMALYEAVLARRPKDSAALAGYGETLQAAGRDAAAEAFLKRAVQIAPSSADVWLALGVVLDDESSPQTEAKTHWGRDAGNAYNKAVSLAPRNPAAWAMRGAFRTWGLPQLQGHIFSRDGLSDYERAASLLPRNPDAQAMVAWIDGQTFATAHHRFMGAKASKLEPPASNRRAEAIMRRITAIAQSSGGAQSAEAYTARAWVQFEFFWDKNEALKSLHLALQQNPNQQDAIDYQMHITSGRGDDALLAAACRRELRRRPQVYLRVLLASADFNIAAQKPKYLREAREQMELAHAAKPRDNALRLGLAVLLLKSGSAADQSRAAALLGEIPAPSHPQVQQADYDLTCGISAMLTGNNDDARRFLQSALQDDPHNSPAKAALGLLPSE